MGHDDPRVNDDTSVSLSVSSGLSMTDEGFQWETAHIEAPTQLTFDTVGDTFIGLYIGQETVEFEFKGKPDSFVQLSFLVGDEPYAINAGYDLLRGFKGIPDNTYVRIQLRKLVDVGQQSPLKSYRVDVAKPPTAGGKRPAATMAERVTGLRDAQTRTLDDEPPF
jgi:hypothetical protein